MPVICNSGGMTAMLPAATRRSPVEPEVGTAVRLARPGDLPAAEAHMRRTIDREFGGYDPRFHTDVDDLAGRYLAPPGRALLVAEVDGRLAGTATVRPGGPAPEFVPRWLADRYADRHVGQVCRVWIDPAQRRRGLGRALGLAAARWALAEGYDPVCLHTNAAVPGALAFWSSFPGAVVVHDARPDPWSTVHFEIDPTRLGAA
jgi:GNAT superfamily N-acetyltransferase